jgi:hypothetical protein
MLVAIGALTAQVSTAHAATATANLASGSLTISPSSVTISYNVTRHSRGQTLNSGFTVTVTDATGTKAGWQILDATARTVSPEADFPIDDHAIVDFDVPAAEGTWPDPTCPCGVISTAFSTILQTPAKTGMGWSRVHFDTQFDVPSDATPGTYTTTLALVVSPPGTIKPMPPVQRATASPVTGGGAPGASPKGRPIGTPAAAPAGSGNPAPLPSARPLVPDATTAPNSGSGRSTSMSQATTNQATTNAAPSVTAVQNAEPTTAATTGAAPSVTVAASPASTSNGATATPVASAASAATTVQQPQSASSAASATSAPVVNPAPAQPQSTGAPNGSVIRAALPAMASAPAVTMSGETVNARTAFVVDTQDRAANWNLQASLGTSDPAADQPGNAIAMNLDVLTGDGGAPVSAQAWTLPFVTGPGALVNVAVPQGIGQATLLLNTQVHVPGGDPAHLAGAVLTITIVTGP